MQHVHYDLERIEAELRKMYAAAPAETLSDDPDVAECFRRSIDVMVASSRFVFTEIRPAPSLMPKVSAMRAASPTTF